MFAALGKPAPDRLLVIAQAFRLGLSAADIHRVTQIRPVVPGTDPRSSQTEARIREQGLPEDYDGLMQLKKMGFSDQRLAELTESTEATVVDLRSKLDLHPVFKRIDTCAAEFPSQTPYMYSTYEGDSTLRGECEAEPSDREKVIILGRRPEPHRPGHRVRLLLRPCGLRPARSRL